VLIFIIHTDDDHPADDLVDKLCKTPFITTGTPFPITLFNGVPRNQRLLQRTPPVLRIKPRRTYARCRPAETYFASGSNISRPNSRHSLAIFHAPNPRLSEAP
jgi:hypothetical protein